MSKGSPPCTAICPSTYFLSRALGQRVRMAAELRLGAAELRLGAAELRLGAAELRLGAVELRLGAAELRELNRIGVNSESNGAGDELRLGGPGGDRGGGRKRYGGSSVRREKPTAAVWKGRRNGRGRR